MELTVLGREGSFLGPEAACSSYVLSDSGSSLLVDHGPGTFAKLITQPNYEELCGVFISHRHDDHWADLSLLSTQRKSEGREPLALLAPQELLGQLEPEVLEAFAPVAIRVSEDQRLGPFLLNSRRTVHGPETYATRILGPRGARFAYSADTGPNFDAPGWAEDCSLLCEASYSQAREGELEHLSGRQAGDLANRLGVSRLWLTHAQPGEDREVIEAEARERFLGPVSTLVVGGRYAIA